MPFGAASRVIHRFIWLTICFYTIYRGEQTGKSSASVIRLRFVLALVESLTADGKQGPSDGWWQAVSGSGVCTDAGPNLANGIRSGIETGWRSLPYIVRTRRFESVPSQLVPVLFCPLFRLLLILRLFYSIAGQVDFSSIFSCLDSESQNGLGSSATRYVHFPVKSAVKKAIQHLVRIRLRKSISSGEQSLNLCESAIRRCFVPPLFRIPAMEGGSVGRKPHLHVS